MPEVQNVRWKPPRAASATSLQNLAWNIATIGDRKRMAGRRGENVAVQYRDGTIWTPKDYDEKEIDLAMWVVGSDEDGEFPEHPSDRFWSNLETLQRLFVTEDQLGELTYWHPVQKKDVTAQCEVRDVIDFSTQAGATRAAFIVRMHIPGIWFRDPTYQGESGYTSRANNDEWTVDVDSDVFIKDAIIKLRASGNTPTNPRLYNLSLSDADNWMLYSDVMQDTEEIEIDIAKWRATLDGTTRVTGNVDWSGNPQFFWLAPGANTLKLEVTDGPIDIQVQAKGAYW